MEKSRRKISYKKPQLKCFGQVKVLTLKIGSTSDVGGMQPMP
ncbi:hypothetical protein [Arundinibacter roseus]|nr:hypothetical protein [Arundinibacter roseus]